MLVLLSTTPLTEDGGEDGAVSVEDKDFGQLLYQRVQRGRVVKVCAIIFLILSTCVHARIDLLAVNVVPLMLRFSVLPPLREAVTVME